MALACLPAIASAQSCPPLRWTTLGTAGGPVPTIDRAEPSNLLQAGKEAILVDTGDGTVNQLAKQRLTLAAVRTVILSHHHLDHTGGLAAVIGLRWMNGFPGVLTLYGPPGTRALVDGIVASMAPPARIGFGLGKAPPPPAGSVRVVEVGDGARFTIDALEVVAAANSHFDHDGGGASAVSLSYRFTLGGRVITYTGDTGPSPAVTKLAKGSDMLVSEVIDLDRLLAGIRRQRPDMDAETAAGMTQHLRTHHLLPADIGAIAATAGVKRVVLTHFAIPGPLSESEATLRSGIATRYAGPVDLARDGAAFDVGCARP
ncbi:MBL fold metallo-hydrolase [Sphingomonas floccifaciens]|uniref:MBL fold metallo-hydrolase n=2 Tax=Sphingomonas floccifaciens TaxID=1844115 RepID=A0ABW4N7Z3_9SPHN